ncbi:transcriptional regulator of acetoin/glycerol metabolism [Pseudonocardia sediminis]|uniref:Transcriptional regulator of acetoin/glycerol metabolism n=1 Tax=Pseudonocardia sediminis TaxID=1397368 RepID=A0A4Q7UYQ3_PSEST|nr:helix-turn-helix domain-containing protein [Pseudonocardia sediminis]RZT87222.1 transcriptional regulator of acetoin/glycerol metabolism [Pseudonocardia sediminis]
MRETGDSTGRRRPAALSGCDPSGPQVARARSAFFVDDDVTDGQVRAPIAASWRRARDWNVDAERIELSRPSETEADSPLLRAARPILDEMSDHFTNEPASLILCDAQGVVLDRRSGDAVLNRRMDAVCLAPGHSYAERAAGTNGIGTALAENRPVQVFGHEHYAEDLVSLACAGSPIRHPVHGGLLGVLDLTCWHRDANPLMGTVALTLGRRIEDALLSQVGRREMSLVDEFLAACEQTRSAIFAVDDDLLMMNRLARELLGPDDQAALLAGTAAVLDSAPGPGRDREFLVDLPTGATARVRRLPGPEGESRGRGVLRVRLATDARSRRPRRGTASYRTFGVVGSAPLWRRCVESVDRHLAERNWMILDGEPGVGKTVLAVAAHRLRKPASHLFVADLAEPSGTWSHEVAEALQEDGATVVLRHLEAVDPVDAAVLADLIEPYWELPGPDRPTVVATYTDRDVRTTDLAALTGMLAVSVTVPPLRHHADDIEDLLAVLVARLGRGATPSFSPAAIRHLRGNPWPGNVAQLRHVASKVLARRRAGTVDVDDLPIECRATVRRVLTPLESIECDAIAGALVDAGGDKARAARQLGMSRATIYRKIREFGITPA